MIIKGASRSDVGFWAAHFVKDENERVSIAEMRGLNAITIRDALEEMKDVASGTRTKNAFYIASLNPCENERLTPEQWEKAADILEHQLGLDGQARMIIEHEKQGRIHRHCVWSRIDLDTMTALPDSFT